MVRRYLYILIIVTALPSLLYAKSISRGSGGGGGPTYLLIETFDTALGYDNAWSDLQGTPDPNYVTSPAPLEGTQSLFMGGCTGTAAVQNGIAFTPTDGEPQELYYIVNIPSIGTVNTDYSIGYIYDSGSNLVGRWYVYRNAGINYFRATVYGGTSAVTVGTVSAATTYHVWLSYQKGTGTNATLSVAFSTDGVRPTSGDNYAQSTGGTRTTDASSASFISTYASATNCIDQIIDRFLVDDATIGNNP